KDLVDSYGYEKPTDSRITATIGNPPLSSGNISIQNSLIGSLHFIRGSTVSPALPTHNPSSPTFHPPHAPNLSFTPNNFLPHRIAVKRENKKKTNRILQWLVRTFLDTKKEPVRFSILQPRFEKHNIPTPNNPVGTLPRQSLSAENYNNYVPKDFNTTLTDKIDEQAQQPLDQTECSVKTPSTIACEYYSDSNTPKTISKGSNPDLPTCIYISPPPGDVIDIIEIDSRRHNHSNSITSIASRDSVDNDLSVY
ncbi:18330_t:CDS:1, partial [Acaulospora morrowiae]